MEYRQLGRCGLQVSSLSIGGWLTFGASIGDGATRDVLRASIDAGINFIDLADVYARGGAELAAGKALGEFKRSELVISTKVFGKMSDSPNDSGLSRKHIVESIDRSLANLGLDYVDLYFCHREDPSVPLDEIARAMDDLVHQGKVLYWGTSVWSAETLRSTHALANERFLYAPVVEQPQYNLLERGIEEKVLPATRELGMGVVVWSPLAGGFLTGKYDDGVPEGSRGADSKWLESRLVPDQLERSRAFSAYARDLGHTPSQLALAWVLAQDGISSAITGATRPEQVIENVAAAEIELEPEVLAKLDEMFPA